uniref:Uncharacterized protein n=1 Tax=Cucumis sativus TaxID=3659 RepID=A0A0A0LUL4_CUCSA
MGNTTQTETDQTTIKAIGQSKRKEHMLACFSDEMLSVLLNKDLLSMGKSEESVLPKLTPEVLRELPVLKWMSKVERAIKRRR